MSRQEHTPLCVFLYMRTPVPKYIYMYICTYTCITRFMCILGRLFSSKILGSSIELSAAVVGGTRPALRRGGRGFLAAWLAACDHACGSVRCPVFGRSGGQGWQPGSALGFWVCQSQLWLLLWSEGLKAGLACVGSALQTVAVPPTRLHPEPFPVNICSHEIFAVFWLLVGGEVCLRGVML